MENMKSVVIIKFDQSFFRRYTPIFYILILFISTVTVIDICRYLLWLYENAFRSKIACASIFLLASFYVHIYIKYIK